MLTAIAGILILLWAFGFIGNYATGDLIHLLLLIALIVLILPFASGRRPA